MLQHLSFAGISMNAPIIGAANIGRGIATSALAGRNILTVSDEDGAKAR